MPPRSRGGAASRRKLISSGVAIEPMSCRSSAMIASAPAATPKVLSVCAARSSAPSVSIKTTCSRCAGSAPSTSMRSISGKGSGAESSYGCRCRRLRSSTEMSWRNGAAPAAAHGLSTTNTCIPCVPGIRKVGMAVHGESPAGNNSSHAVSAASALRNVDLPVLNRPMIAILNDRSLHTSPLPSCGIWDTNTRQRHRQFFAHRQHQRRTRVLDDRSHFGLDIGCGGCHSLPDSFT